MKLFSCAVLCSVPLASAFVAPKVAFKSPSMALGAFDQEQYIAESKEMRLKHLEEQAMFALKISCENFDNAGKVVIMVFFSYI